MNTKFQFTLLICLAIVNGIWAQTKTDMNKNNIAAAHGQVITKGKMVYSEITINATPERVWAVLTDFGSYPSWNPFITSFKGIPVVGKQVEAFLQPPAAKGMTFKPQILQYERNKELRWIGKLGIGWIFDGEHAFVLKANNDGTTTLMQYEHFRGILVPFMKKMLDNNTLQGFRMMNEALKKRVEG